MVALPITVSATIGEDRRLVVELPENTPTGQVQVVIMPAPTTATNPARESMRSKLLEAGALRTVVDVPADARALALEERIRIGTIPEGSPTAEELVNEDRGEW
jgi:hypothetical protein